MTSGLRIVKPVLTTIVVLLIFVVAFIAFILAPLVMVVLVVGLMWGYERYTNSRRQPGVRSLSTPRSLAREAGGEREGSTEQTYGFGSGLGRDL